MDRDVITREVKVDGVWVSLEAYRGMKRTEEIKQIIFSVGFVLLIGIILVTFLWAL